LAQPINIISWAYDYFFFGFGFGLGFLGLVPGGWVCSAILLSYEKSDYNE